MNSIAAKQYSKIRSSSLASLACYLLPDRARSWTALHSPTWAALYGAEVWGAVWV